MRMTHDSIPPEPSDAAKTEEEEYYFDGPYLVFTEAYHRKRGFCCQSGCRHCPYGFVKNNRGPCEVSRQE